MTESAFTLVKNAVHNPADARHFMRFKPIARRVEVSRNGELLASSARAMRLNEVGRDIYDSVVYIPHQDCSKDLQTIPGKSTHCPLKGDASYLSLDGKTAIAWTYDRPIEAAACLLGYVAFYADEVTVTESGKAAG